MKLIARNQLKGTIVDIQEGAVNGIVNGTAPGQFSPTSNITREQIAVILYRYTGSDAMAGSLEGFPDSGKVSAFADDALLWATDTGLINGVKSGAVPYLVPQNNATRAQIAAIIMRFMQG